MAVIAHQPETGFATNKRLKPVTRNQVQLPKVVRVVVAMHVAYSLEIGSQLGLVDQTNVAKPPSHGFRGGAVPTRQNTVKVRTDIICTFCMG